MLVQQEIFSKYKSISFQEEVFIWGKLVSDINLYDIYEFAIWDIIDISLVFHSPKKGFWKCIFGTMPNVIYCFFDFYALISGFLYDPNYYAKWKKYEDSM